MKAKYGEDFDMFSPPELAPFNTIPALVFHDVDDRDTPISLGRRSVKNQWNLYRNSIGPQTYTS